MTKKKLFLNGFLTIYSYNQNVIYFLTKQMKKIFTILILFLFFFYPVFAYEAEISVNNEKVLLSDNFKLSINIKNVDNLEEIQISKINGIDNFEVLGTNQSNRVFSQSKVVNGKIEEQRETTTLFEFILKPKNIGEFSLGPISFDNGVEKKDTNIVKINVLKDEVEVKNDLPENTNYSLPVDEFSGKNNINDDKDGILFFILIALFILLVFMIFLQTLRNKRDIDNLENSNKNTGYEDSLEENLNNLDFDINSKNFVSDIENVLKIKINKKYNISHENKSLGEIIESTDFEDKELLNKINLGLNKIKYSDLYFDKEKFLEDVKSYLGKL
ncbi:hypothetical protein DLH72_00060 [Candidatus Gracilibacteria bacterium]|nr:MAG: hypothetical protein DLH72_00060 [Candidatus Gracilibacteria bacterium]